MALPPDLTELANTYPLPSNATFKGGITKFLNYTKGLLGATGNAPEARVALGIGNAISNRNLLDNATFRVNQRNQAGTVTLAAGSYGHDRWKAGAAGCTYTFAASGNDFVITITAGSLIQIVEALNVEGGTYSMTWTGTSQGKIGAGAFAASGVSQASVPANANLSVEFGTGTLSKVQLEVGAPTPFERKHLATDTLNCQRYFWQGQPFLGVNFYAAVSGAHFTLSIQWPAEMRAAPTAGTSGSVTASGVTGVAVSGGTKRGANMFMQSNTTGNVNFSIGTLQVFASAEL